MRENPILQYFSLKIRYSHWSLKRPFSGLNRTNGEFGGSKTPKQLQCLQNKGKCNETKTGPIRRIGLKWAKIAIKREKAKRKNGSIFTWPRVGGGGCPRRSLVACLARGDSEEFRAFRDPEKSPEFPPTLNQPQPPRVF